MRNWRVDLGNGYWYDNKPDHTLQEEILDHIEDKYNCHFVSEWYLNKKSMVLLFWNDVAHPQGSNWLGVYGAEDQVYLCDGIAASQLPIRCAVSNDKQVLFSKSRHDFRSSNDGSVTVDGGRDYTRMLGNIKCERVNLLPQNGMLTIIDDSAAQILLSGIKQTA